MTQSLQNCSVMWTLRLLVQTRDNKKVRLTFQNHQVQQLLGVLAPTFKIGHTTAQNDLIVVQIENCFSHITILKNELQSQYSVNISKQLLLYILLPVLLPTAIVKHFVTVQSDNMDWSNTMKDINISITIINLICFIRIIISLIVYKHVTVEDMK